LESREKVWTEFYKKNMYTSQCLPPYIQSSEGERHDVLGTSMSFETYNSINNLKMSLTMALCYNETIK